MSVGLVLMNKTAVVMAADSAVTIGNRSAIYNTSQKLFKLSDEIPVATLIFANASFMGVPIELIVKMFANNIRKNNSKYDYLIDYGKAFRSFLVENQTLFNFAGFEENYMTENAYNFFQFIRGRVSSIIREEHHNNDKFSDETLFNVIKKAIRASKDDIEKRGKEVKRGCGDYIKEKYPRLVSKIIKTELERNNIDDITYNLYFSLIGQLEDLFASFFNIEFNFGVATGVVFAGYGEKELYPSTQCFELLGFVNGILRHRLVSDGEITLEKPRYAGKYAQQKMLDAFIEGIDSEVQDDLIQAHNNYYAKSFSELDANLFSDEHLKELFSIIDDSQQVIIDEIFNITRSNWAPIYNAIEVLPQEELADLAENLINVSSLKSKYSVDADMNSTVGGLADVCILNKIDGFKWYAKKKFNK